MIEKLSSKTAEWLMNSLGIKGQEIASKTLSDNLGTEYVLHNKEDCVEVIAYQVYAIYSELIKTICILIIAGLLGVLIPTLIISITFSILRQFSGGEHMSTSTKCLIVGLLFYLSGAFIIMKLPNSNIFNLCFSFMTSILSLKAITLYAPRDTKNKRITDYTTRAILKRKSLICTSFMFVVSIILNNHKLISPSINIGVLIEMFSITPTGVTILQWLDNINLKKFKK